MLPIIQEKYSGLFGLLSAWRGNVSNKKTGYSGILPFVSGLRFSVQILYIIKDILEHSDLDASWGHIMKSEGEYALYSNECDIIIFKKETGCVVGHWNGRTKGEYKAMDFKFIDQKAVVGVISCKSGIGTSKIDKNYPNQLKQFTKNVWLFAEYCDHNKYDSIKTKAKGLGYKDFWCLYEWNHKKGANQNVKSYEEFHKQILAIAKARKK